MPPEIRRLHIALEELQRYAMLRNEADFRGEQRYQVASALELGGLVSQRRVIDAEQDQWVKWSDIAALLAASPAPQRQDDQEDTRVEPLVVAQEHGDLSRKSQPDGSLQLKCSRCGRLAFGANIGDVDHLLQPNKRPCGGFFR